MLEPQQFYLTFLLSYNPKGGKYSPPTPPRRALAPGIGSSMLGTDPWAALFCHFGSTLAPPLTPFGPLSPSCLSRSPFCLLFPLPPAPPRSIFALPYHGFGTFSLSLLVASMVLSGPLFGLSWAPGASLCRPWALLWEPFFVKSGPAISG